jgi:hypothetical protein
LNSSPAFRPDDRLAEGRLGAEDLHAVDGLLAAAQEVGLLLAGDVQDTTVPGPATPAAPATSPTTAVLSSVSSWRMRASIIPCSFLAAS